MCISTLGNHVSNRSNSVPVNPAKLKIISNNIELALAKFVMVCMYYLVDFSSYILAK